MFTKRSLEGELTIDHRNSPGITPEQAHLVGAIPVRGGTVFQSPTVTCGHCQRQIVMNPDRSRSRGYCRGCDRYVCDECELIRTQTGLCNDFERFADNFLNRAAKGLING